MIESPVETLPSSTSHWLPLGVCSLGTFLLLLYGTVVTVSTPTITAELRAPYSQGQWQLDIYTLALAALVLALGSAGDRVGHRRVFVHGAGVFAVATALCGAASTGIELIVLRAAQGVGGAALFAATIPLLALRYEGRDRARAFAVWGTVAGAGSTVGTLAGGVVTQYASWRWLFFGSLPICAATVIGALRHLPRDAPRSGAFDWAGSAGITLAAGAITFGAINAGDHGWTSPVTLTALVAGPVLAGVTVQIERHVAAPLLPLADLRSPRLLAAVICGFAYYLASFSALPSIASWLQHGLGISALASALLLSLQIVAFVAVTLVFAARLHTSRADRVLVGGTLLTGLACLTGAMLLMVAPHAGWPSLLPMLLFSGLGAGLVTPILPTVAVTAVPPRHTGTAAAASNAARQFGLTVGIAVCGAVARQRATDGTPSAAGVGVGLLLGCGVATAAAALSWWLWHRSHGLE